MSRYLLTDPSHRLTCSGFPSKFSGDLTLISDRDAVVAAVAAAAAAAAPGMIGSTGGGISGDLGIWGLATAKDARVLAVNSSLVSSNSSDEELGSSDLSDGGVKGICSFSELSDGSGESSSSTGGSSGGSVSRGLVALSLGDLLDEGLS
jgi:hypothetical protein